MKLTVQKWGNDVGLAIPEAMLHAYGIAVGQSFEMKRGAAGSLVLEPKAKGKKYSAAQLNALCNLDAPMPVDLQSWDSLMPKGLESL